MADIFLVASVYGVAWCFHRVFSVDDVEAATHRAQLTHKRDCGFLFVFSCVCVLFLMFLWLSDTLSGDGARVWKGFS